MNTQEGWIGVDLDGTLAHYDKWRGITHIGSPIPSMVERVKLWIQEGKRVKIFTARVGEQNIPSEENWKIVPAIKSWCDLHIGQELEITCCKDFGMIELWDDRCVQVIPNTGERADGKL